MARPAKKGLAYFPKDVDYYQDEKIVELMMKYGPIGLATFDVLLTVIYREGYYIEMSVAKAALMVVRTVGDSWYKKNGMTAIDFAAEIILYCAEIGLFDESLVRQEVMTSVGIQKRYASVTARNKVDKSKYWLLDNDRSQTACESAPKNQVIAAKTGVSVAETTVNDAKMKQSKEKKIKVNESSVCKQNFCSRNSDNMSDDDDKARMVISEYERLLPGSPKAVLSSRLKKNIAQGGRDISEYSRAFLKASESRFLTSAPWCGIEWLTKPENLDRVLSGSYDDFNKSPAKSSSTAPESSDSDKIGGISISEIERAIYSGGEPPRS